MKNFRDYYGRYLLRFLSKKTIRVMKLTFLLSILTISHLWATETYSQITKLTLKLEDVRISDALKEIENQSEFFFLYSPKLIDVERKVNIEAEKEPINDILNDLFDAKVKFVVYDRQIILTPSDVTALPEALQQQKIFGTITGKDGTPLAGVNVVVTGTTQGAISDVGGRYSIDVPKGAKSLTFSFIGMEPQEINIGTLSQINVTMAVSAIGLEEVVVVGYGIQKKVNLTGSVASVSTKELENRPLTEASQALSGLVSGVTVTQGSGRPGNDFASIKIRGLGTFSGAGNEPLVLVDGLASSIDNVDPNNIKSISVLKDAASAAIYGNRAANGVILIETKRGQKGVLQVSYNSYIGWQKVTELPDFLGSSEYAKYRNEAGVNEGGLQYYTDAQIALFKSGSDPDNYPNVPHLKNLLTSGSGFQTNHNLNFMGGDEKNSYLFSMGYLRQDGIVTKNDYTKYNFLLNIDSKIKDNLTLKVNLSANDGTTNEPRHSMGDITSLIAFAVREPSVYAGKKSDGTYGHQDAYGQEKWLAGESFTQNNNKMFLGGIDLSWEIIRGLTLSGKAGYNYSINKYKYFTAEETFDPIYTVGPNKLEVGSADGSLITLQSLVNYAKKINRHSFNVLAGISQETSKNNYSTDSRQYFPNNLLYELNAGAASTMFNSGTGDALGLRSFFGRLNYSFNEKYLIEANARYDGTSRFPKNSRWGLFPSFSAGWRISEESFIKDNLNWIDNLKVRASWGKLGNQNVGNYPYQSFVTLGRDYSFGGIVNSGAQTTVLANKEITWESTQITDIGFDLAVLKGKLNMVVDYFDKTTSGILYKIFVSGMLGMTPSESNAGGVRNTGFEFLLNYQTSIGNVNIGIAPNFSYTKNRVTELASGVQKDIGSNLFVGEPLQSIYGYVADGLFVDANDVATYPTQPYSAEPGFVRYKDISGPDGVPDGKVDATYDRKVIGSTLPKYSFGATITADYKGFDFSLLLHGLGGFEKQMTSYEAFAFYNDGQIQQWQVDNRWTTENPDRNAKYIKLTNLASSNGSLLTSTYWNRNASFLRVKNLQIGYTLPKSIVQKLKIDNLRVFLSGQNLFTFNHFYKGWDPEMVQDNDFSPKFYPITSVYTMGVNVKF
jgi:TonB-dependent starch-binding outer membrane protein SusC